MTFNISHKMDVVYILWLDETVTLNLLQLRQFSIRGLLLSVT